MLVTAVRLFLVVTLDILPIIAVVVVVLFGFLLLRLLLLAVRCRRSESNGLRIGLWLQIIRWAELVVVCPACPAR